MASRSRVLIDVGRDREALVPLEIEIRARRRAAPTSTIAERDEHVLPSHLAPDEAVLTAAIVKRDRAVDDEQGRRDRRRPPLVQNAEPDREADHPPDQEQIDRTEQPGRETSCRRGTARTRARLVGLDSDLARVVERQSRTAPAAPVMTPECATIGEHLLERRVAAERRVEDREREAGDDERQDRRQDQLDRRPRSSARTAPSSPSAAYWSSLTVRPNDSIGCSCWSSDGLLADLGGEKREGGGR